MSRGGDKAGVRPDRNAAPFPLIEYGWISLLDQGEDLAAEMVELRFVRR
jgi:hypothetical protein